MGSKFPLVIGVIASILLGAWAITARSQSAGPGSAWEYQEIQLQSNQSSMPVLNKLGSQGWELVNVVAACQADEYCQWWAYLKRRL
jgi:hypothetical protein